jgi:signal transduction histidine kinase/CheY-like chemotaxis protein
MLFTLNFQHKSRVTSGTDNTYTVKQKIPCLNAQKVLTLIFKIMRVLFTFKKKMFVLLFVIFTIVSITGFYAYKRFSGIVSLLVEKTSPDMFLVSIKSLVNSVNEAEIFVKTFSLTKNTEYLDKFYIAANDANKKLLHIDTLRDKSPHKQEKLDSLKILVDQKFQLLNAQLLLQDKFRVEQALNKVVKKLEIAAIEENLAEPEKAYKKGLLSWLFRKKTHDTIEKKTVYPQSTVSFDQIDKEVLTVKKEEQKIESELKQQEIILIVESTSISNKITSIIDHLEQLEMQTIIIEAEKAEKAVQKTNSQIAFFCLLAAFFLILIGYVTANFIRNTNRYKKALEKAKWNAERLAATKEKFLANISHEIRTPMNAIAGFSEQLSLGKLNKYQQEHVSMIRKSVEHLLYLVNDVLDFSKLRVGKVSLESVGFLPNEAIKEAIDFISPLATEKKLTITYVSNIPETLVLIGDPFRLKQIILNLLSNSVKFTEEGGVSIKSFSVLQNEKNMLLRIEVSDTGIGINKNSLSKIFQEFEQGEASATHSQGGTGLGLSIVNLLIRLHHGKIELTSTPMKGTTVIIELPYAIGTKNNLKQKHPSKKIAVGTLPENLNVLVVDDNVFNRKLLTTILKKHRASYTEATNGKEAIKEIKNNNYDLVLMDVRMPELDGIEATKKIRALPIKTKKNIPIIMLTAAVAENDRLQYQDIKASGFLAKPFTECDLIETILKNLKQRKNE